MAKKKGFPRGPRPGKSSTTPALSRAARMPTLDGASSGDGMATSTNAPKTQPPTKAKTRPGKHPKAKVGRGNPNRFSGGGSSATGY